MIERGEGLPATNVLVEKLTAAGILSSRNGVHLVQALSGMRWSHSHLFYDTLVIFGETPISDSSPKYRHLLLLIFIAADGRPSWSLERATHKDHAADERSLE